MADALHTQQRHAHLVRRHRRAGGGAARLSRLLDPIGALLVAVFIARTGWEIARDTSRILADRVVLDEEASAAS